MTRTGAVVALLAGVLGACSSKSAYPGFTAKVPVGAPAEPGTVIHGEGGPCGGYPAPGEPIALCGKGLQCDFDDAAVDGPGRCRR
jgi:hypothetical protein